MKRLDESQIINNLKDNPSWERVNKKSIKRVYRFKNFLSGIHFIHKIAMYAEEKGHHPSITIDYKIVTVKMSSWEAEGLTSLDFEMATHFDELFNKAVK